MHSLHNPSTPLVHPFHEDLVVGSKIDFHGHLHHGHHKVFCVELLSGPHIVLHMSFRFEHHEHVLVLNSSSYGQWGPEQRIHNPIHHDDSHFHLSIHVHHNHYDIHVNGHHVTSYNHRYSYQSVQALGVHGDLRLEHVHFEGFPFHHKWDREYDWGHSGYIGYGTSSYVAPVFTDGHRHHSFWGEHHGHHGHHGHH